MFNVNNLKTCLKTYKYYGKIIKIIITYSLLLFNQVFDKSVPE